MNEELLKQLAEQFLNNVKDDQENQSNQDDQMQRAEEVIGEMSFDMFGDQSLSVVLSKDGFSTKLPKDEKAMLSLIAWIFDTVEHHVVLSDKGMLQYLSILNDASSKLAGEISSYLEEE
ncbi:hypothetical protein OXT66_03145 [Lentilactobacillus senioris]|uniref:hypothetical protein n=1 Tax=Lentilactobacillus senioris TaxID=931534 RepID=UPI00228031A8|nr:hypothetical protein [Lentilactobacillus senioris]MCY9806545.1 hypothetical protein [Lentilactobacillus senioris]